ncbi:MAG TPA: YicC family protein [Spirochaetota bacterium]|nr:YicC family protein [Spirochaetota bacterium]HPF06011.1 YicC family protein [Spirochaetota bacterium]HPJ41839.1 YicC family protein [Spirochaetota bacterium]HPR36806.1 YicC family protein [Spirochaetota bacterium]HRX46345.1 YicC family protein [Spirochaetota bacterium]
MESMTGYAFVEKSSDQFSYSVEIKSLNSKYLEVFVNLPKIMRNEENELIQIVKKNFTRGKIELNIDIFDWNNIKPVSLNTELMKKYYYELEILQRDLKIKEPLKFDSLLLLEGITQKERSVLTDRSKKDIYITLDAVISKTIDMRKKEGISIRKDITASLSLISKDVSRIKTISKKVIDEKKETLKNRLKVLTEGNLDNTRLYTEIAIMADKLDINEELVRMNDHLEKLKILMKEKGQMGRKLDFLSQELFREINTIASKSNNSEISHMVVDIKNHIDKIREHCRNIV